jgi:hypothetical protein
VTAAILTSRHGTHAVPGWVLWPAAVLACALITDGLRRLWRRAGR